MCVNTYTRGFPGGASGEDPTCQRQETERENLSRTRACSLQNLKYFLSDALPAFTYSCPVAAALFEGLVKTQCWLLHPEFWIQGPENWCF